MDNAHVLGETIEEFETMYRESLSKYLTADALNRLEIQVQVQPAPELVYILGEFRSVRVNPIELRPGMTLQEAISAAGGLNILGDTDWALLRRPYRDAVHPELYRIDLNDWNEEIVLLPDDQIVLQKNYLAMLIEYIREYIFGFLPTTSLGALGAFGAI